MSDSTRKPPGYWEVLDNVCVEIERWMAEHGGKFPTAGLLKKSGLSSLVANITKHHGGFYGLRGQMKAERVERPKGHWKDFANVEREIRAWMDSHDGEFPTTGALEAEGHGALVRAVTRHHRGFHAVRQRIGGESSARPSGHWKDFANVEREIRAWMDSHDGEFPNSSQLRLSGMGGLVTGITEHHDGFFAVRNRMGVTHDTKPMGYWQNRTNVEREIRAWMDSHDGEFPTRNVLKKAGLSSLASAITTYHGGFQSLRTQMGRTPLQYPRDYWRDWTNVERTLRAEMQIRGHLPSDRELKKGGLSTVAGAIARYHGGMAAVRQRLGERPIVVPKGHWQEFRNVANKIEEVMETLGRFPSQDDLATLKLSSVAVSCSKYHGGLANVRGRMGYNPAARHLLPEFTNDLIAVVDALGIQDTLGFWARICDRWLERDLRAAIRVFHEDGSLDAFRALAAD